MDLFPPWLRGEYPFLAHRLQINRTCGTIWDMKRADHGQECASHPLEGFPRPVASASARKSLER